MADLLPDGFIWMPFCPDLDQAESASEHRPGRFGNTFFYASAFASAETIAFVDRKVDRSHNFEKPRANPTDLTQLQT